jgi:hypothetical protein
MTSDVLSTGLAKAKKSAAPKDKVFTNGRPKAAWRITWHYTKLPDIQHCLNFNQISTSPKFSN